MSGRGRLIGAALAIFGIAAGPRAAMAEPAAAALISRLEGVGFFQLMPNIEATTVRQEIERQGLGGIFYCSSLIVIADGEEIAENGAGEFVRRLAPRLERHGVSLGAVAESITEGRQSLTVDGRETVVWDSARDGDPNASLELAVKFWGISAARAFAAVNDRLAETAAPIRIYAVGGGQDGIALVLTPKVARELSAIPALGRSRPYLPSEALPDFGAPSP